MVGHIFRNMLLVILLAAGLLGVALGLISTTNNAPATIAPHKPETSNRLISQSNTSIPVNRPAGTAASHLVARVNDSPITRDTWEQASRLDQAMNDLTGAEPVSPEETLDRLINEQLLLAATGQTPAISDDDAAVRLQMLLTTREIDAATLQQTLTDHQLSDVDLQMRVKRLLAVEAALQNLVQQGQDPQEWLRTRRQQAEISVLIPMIESVALAARPETDTRPTQAPPPPAGTATAQQPRSDLRGLTTQVSTGPAAPEPGPDLDLPIRPYPGALSPDFTLNQADGTPITLSELRGRPVVVNFWASWCSPCQRELPDLQAAYENYQTQAHFVAVNVKEDPTAVQKFIDERNLSFPIVFDQAGDVQNRYEVRGIPTTLILDAAGVVVQRHVGPISQEQLAAYLAPHLPLTTPDNIEVQTSLNMTPKADPVPTAGPPLPIAPSAPLFELPDQTGEPFVLAEALTEGPVVLIFYRGAT